MRLAIVVAVAGIALAACSPAEQAATSTTTPPAADPTPAASEAAPAGPPLELSDPDADGVITVTVDPMALSPLFYDFNDANADDPFYQIHTNDGELFVGIELYTLYGDTWTGQLGTFTLDCSGSGICVYLDPDGTGPLDALGPASKGKITIDQLDGGYDVTLTGVKFPGYALADLHLVG